MLRHLALAFLIAAPCVAQSKSTISPPDLTNIYTGSNNGIPFGGYQSAEQLYQQVDSSLFELAATAQVFPQVASDACRWRYSFWFKLDRLAQTPAGFSKVG